MAANINPIYPLVPNSGARNVVLTAANTTKDGTAGTTLVYTAGANGGRVKYLRLQAIGTNVASLLRVFLNNGSAVGTAANNSPIGELPLPIATLSETAMSGPPMVLPIDLELGPNERLYVVLATAVAAGWAVTAHGGDF
jgi:hypothetical protein